MRNKSRRKHRRSRARSYGNLNTSISNRVRSYFKQRDHLHGNLRADGFVFGKRRFGKHGYRFGSPGNLTDSKLGLASAIAIIILLRSGFWSLKYKQSFIDTLNAELTQSAQGFLFSMSIDSLFDLIEHAMGWSRRSIDRNLAVALYLAISGIHQNKL